MENSVSLEMNEKILSLRSYFSLEDAPEELLGENPSLAKRAIRLLDRIEKISGIEYAFIHIQEGPFGGYCAPSPKNYQPENRDITKVLGRYDRQYFVNFLKKKE